MDFRFIQTAFIIFLIIIIGSCSKDSNTSPNCTPGAVCDDGNPNTSGDKFDDNCFCSGTANTGFELGTDVLIDVGGRVLDEAGSPMPGVTVSCGNKTTATDAQGVFVILDASAKENLAFVKAVKTGYFQGSRSFVPTQGVNRVEIRMLEKTEAGVVDATVGGSVTSENVQISFSGGSFDKDGSAYSGQVHVSINYIDPESDNFNEEMPGALVGVQDGNGKVLTSYGMAAVELTDGAGNVIDLAEGTTAEIRFPVPASLLSGAPEEIDLWYFDENNGYWVNDGTASLSGNEYVGEVSHFSFWNCDFPNDFIYLHGHVTDENGNGLSASVEISSPDYGTADAYTGTEGNFGGYVPSGEVLNIKVKFDCGDSLMTVYSGSIGPLYSSTTLPDIVISILQNTTVTGIVVDCESMPVEQGYVIAYNQIYLVENGLFSFVACGDNLTLTPFETGTNYEAGDPVIITLNGSEVNADTVYACGNLLMGEFTDPRDGQTYATIIIGNQEWFAENLNYATGVSYCFFGNQANCNVYGRLYDHPTALTGCPAGWHLPSNAEWQELAMVAGADNGNLYFYTAGGHLKEAGLVHWDSPNTDASNTTGFTGLPGGYGYDNPGGCGSICWVSMGATGNFWSTDLSATYEIDSNAYRAILRYNDATFAFGLTRANFSYNSVRCIKD